MTNNFPQFDDEVPSNAKQIGDIVSSRISFVGKKGMGKERTFIHSEMHELAEKCYKQFGETAKKGKGSFPFYLGFIKRLGLQTTYRILAELRADGKSNAGRLFWYKVKLEFQARASARRRAEMGIKEDVSQHHK